MGQQSRVDPAGSRADLRAAGATDDLDRVREAQIAAVPPVAVTKATALEGNAGDLRIGPAVDVLPLTMVAARA